MNYGELKNSVKNLGFEEDEAMDEYKEIVAAATNMALREIAASAFPLKARFDLSQDGSEAGAKRHDMAELTKKDGKRTFLCFSDPPVKTRGGLRAKVPDFEIEEDRVLVMDGGLAGDFTVFYHRAPETVAANAPDETPIDVDARVEGALPLLVAYYVWLDDDERKAQRYKNDFEERKAETLAEAERPRAKIRGGFR